ncbi:UDP-N-acetylglucosamine 2-epimerase, partial [Listeria monocytogenes]|nr:UDP-N-acetylglucosamine 2-epimerase [Listeria monocytogenes]
DRDRLSNIINALSECGVLVILPLHPRTRKFIDEYGIKTGSNIIIIDPVGYIDMIQLEINARKIVTDSGGVQKEAFFLKKPCITMRE